MKSVVSIPAYVTLEIIHQESQNEDEIRKQALNRLRQMGLNKETCAIQINHEMELVFSLDFECENPSQDLDILEANKS
jgi:plasmid maintenance system killer protein